MSADRLAEAARVLRERAKEATPGPWEAGNRCVWTLSDPLNSRPAVIDDGYDGSGGATYSGDAEYIATMHPGVALALADWLAVESANDGHLPHRFPKDAPAEVISWKCQECGELINEMHTQASPCPVDWRPRNPFAVRVADLILGSAR